MQPVLRLIEQQAEGCGLSHFPVSVEHGALTCVGQLLKAFTQTSLCKTPMPANLNTSGARPQPMK